MIRLDICNISFLFNRQVKPRRPIRISIRLPYLSAKTNSSPFLALRIPTYISTEVIGATPAELFALRNLAPFGRHHLPGLHWAFALRLEVEVKFLIFQYNNQDASFFVKRSRNHPQMQTLLTQPQPQPHLFYVSFLFLE